MKKITAIIEASSTGFGAYSESLPGITGYGKTVDQAKKDIQSAFEEVVEAHREDNTMPKEYNNGDIEFIFKYDIASIFSYFGVLNVSEFAKKVGLNASLLRQYKTGISLASDRQKNKIEAGLHQLGKELMKVRL